MLLDQSQKETQTAGRPVLGGRTLNCSSYGDMIHVYSHTQVSSLKPINVHELPGVGHQSRHLLLLEIMIPRILLFTCVTLVMLGKSL